MKYHATKKAGHHGGGDHVWHQFAVTAHLQKDSRNESAMSQAQKSNEPS
jgi:hypothetical protein